MRKFVLISLLLLSVLNDHQARGIRLIERSLSAQEDQHNRFHEENSDLMRINVGRRAPATASEEDHGSESGSNRKLMTKTSSPSSTTTTTTSKNDKKDHEGNNKAEPTVLQKGQSSSTERSLGGKVENFSVNSSSTTVAPDDQHPPPSETNVSDHYPDIIDIAGMDYSPAKRKPPIHN